LATLASAVKTKMCNVTLTTPILGMVTLCQRLRFVVRYLAVYKYVYVCIYVCIAPFIRHRDTGRKSQRF